MTDSLIGDVRQAARALARQPGLTAVAVLTLGLGIGASGTIFTAFNSLLLREPPFHEPERLVRITSARGDEDGGALSVPELDDLRGLTVFDDVAMYTDQAMYNASGFGTPQELQATIATHNIFRLLGVEPMIGSPFPPSFDRTRNFGVVISHGLWIRTFGGDPGIVGRSMTLDGAPGYTIYGVMPPAFNFPTHSDLFRSAGISADPAFYQRRDARERFVVARLAPGVGLREAAAAVEALARRLEREFPLTNSGLRFRVTSIRDMYSAGTRPYVLVLFGAVLVVLIVACANVASVLLSRALARDREMAVRSALGAGRWRMLRPFIAESVVLATGGAILGSLTTVVGVRWLAALVPLQLAPWMQVQVDARVAAFVVAAAAATTIMTGLLPGLRGTAVPYAALKDGARGSSGATHHRARALLIVAEVALAVVLVIGASLLLQSIWKLQRVDLGFETARTLTFRVQLGWSVYGTLDKTVVFHDTVLDRLRALPGVRAVTFDTNLPMSGAPRAPVAIHVEGQSRDEAGRNPFVNLHRVGPDYFAAMGIDVRGRVFDSRDRAVTGAVVIVSEQLAARLWPDRDPVGQRLRIEDADPSAWSTVVGIAGGVRHQERHREPELDVYVPYTQRTAEGPYYIVRTSGEPMAIAAAATAVIGDTDPHQSFLDVQSYDRRVAARIWQQRLTATLTAGFASLAVLLAVVGLYGILSYAVKQQTRDIGVRLALGAAPGAVAIHVLRHGLGLAGAGIAAGAALALMLTRVVGSVLYDVSPQDPATFAGVSAALLLMAALACALPARRAMRVDPIVALRTD